MAPLARRVLPTLTLLGLLLAAGPGSALVPATSAQASKAAAAAPARVTSVEGITEYRLANGLRVLIFPDPSKPTITTSITYLVGSRHEQYGETGMAHLLEHMLFKGTPARPDTWKILNELGGDANGSTSLDRTNYYVSFPASEENLAKALGLEADRMLNCSFSAETLWGKDGKSGEMTVVRNEFEQGENNPIRVTLERVQSVAFDWHNYGKSTIGARTDIEKVNVDHLRAFYAKYYQPDNAILMVAGKIDEAKALAMVQAAFGGIPRPSRVLEPTYTLDPTQDGERSVTVRRVGGTPALLAAYHVPAGAHADHSYLGLAASILTDPPGGRLYKALVETRLAAQVFPFSFGDLEPGIAFFGAILPKDADVDKAREALLRELEDLQARPFTQAELERAKTKARKAVEHGLADTKELAIELSESMAAGDWRHWFLDRDRALGATLEQVQLAAATYFKPSNRTLGTYLPTERPSRAEIPAAPDLAAQLKDYQGKAPQSQGEAFDASPANVDRRAIRGTAPNGMKLALLPKKTKGGMVSVQLALHFGQEAALMGRGAIPNLAGAMLMRGSARHSRQELTDAFDKLRAQVMVGGSAAGASASVQVPQENLEPALRLLAEVLREPAFPAAELETMQKQQATGIESQRSEPQAKAMEFIASTWDPYPGGHPSAYRNPDQRLADLKAAKAEDLKAFHAAFYGADHAEFAASGELDPARLQALAVELFGSWRSASPYARIPARVKAAPGANRSIETPDKQMAFFTAQLRWPMQEGDPDWPAFLMANQILGGGELKNRIAERLRQKEGFSYGAGSFTHASPLDPSALWQAYAICAPQNMTRLEAAFNEELGKALQDGFTQEELDFAKKSWLQGEEVARQEDRAVAQTLAQSLYLGRSVLFQAELEAKVKALQLPEVNAALRKYLKPSALVVAKAGDFAKAAQAPAAK